MGFPKGRGFAAILLVIATGVGVGIYATATRNEAPSEEDETFALRIVPPEARPGELVRAVIDPSEERLYKDSGAVFQAQTDSGNWRTIYSLTTGLPGSPAGAYRCPGSCATIGVGMSGPAEDTLRIPPVEPGVYRIVKNVGVHANGHGPVAPLVATVRVTSG